jgi:putative Holliday junction resolvase
MGIDYGTKRIGIAVSDPDAQFALPHSVIQNSTAGSKKHFILDEISKVALENETSTIVMGESRDYKGQPNKILPDALELKKDLELKGFTVYLELEFMTSQHAERVQGKTDKSDSSAAALILQSYLDSHRNK